MKGFTSFVVFASLSAISFQAFAQDGAAAAPAKQGTKLNMSEKIFDPTRDSAKDIAAAIKLATKQNKPILIDVGGNWCSWCHKLDALFKTDKEIGKLLKKYVVVQVNYSQENKNEKVLANFPKITGYPHLFVLDKTGKVIHSQDTGLLETGDHHDPAKVIEFLTKFSK
jgi:thioredoxin-related protein